MVRGAFPDFHYVLDDNITEGDNVVQRLTGHGTMKGSFFNFPATGKHAAWGEIHISRVGSDDKFVEQLASTPFESRKGPASDEGISCLKNLTH